MTEYKIKYDDMQRIEAMLRNIEDVLTKNQPVQAFQQVQACQDFIIRLKIGQ